MPCKCWNWVLHVRLLWTAAHIMAMSLFWPKFFCLFVFLFSGALLALSHFFKVDIVLAMDGLRQQAPGRRHANGPQPSNMWRVTH